MATNSLLCRHVFGINTNLQDNLSFLDETNYVYVAGMKYMNIYFNHGNQLTYIKQSNHEHLRKYIRSMHSENHEQI